MTPSNWQTGAPPPARRHAPAIPHGAAAPWQPDRGDGMYQNPVLFADYSDPDAIRVGDDFWLTASSFSHVPGLPILHSRDLVNWSLVNHALPTLSYPTPLEPTGKGGRTFRRIATRWRRMGASDSSPCRQVLDLFSRSGFRHLRDNRHGSARRVDAAGPREKRQRPDRSVSALG